MISWNVNGLRACVTKGFEKYFKEADADVFCLREFDSLIMKKSSTGPIKPVLFLSKILFYYIAIFSNL